MTWFCPRDRQALEPREARLVCPDCGGEYPVVEEIAVFAGEEAGVDRPDPGLDELTGLMQRSSADDAAREFCGRRSCSRTPRGADWKLFLSYPRDAHVLEIGSGFGDDVIELARRAGRVTSIVPSVSNARILIQHLRERKIDNVAVAVLDDIERLPLADDSVAAIAMEDAAAPGFRATGRNLETIAAEWRRVLQPRGSLLLGLDNRFARVLGLRLAQSKLQARSRPDSLNRYVKQAASGAPGRLPGLQGVMRNLARQGFGAPAVYAPLPDEKRAHVVVPLDDPPVLRYFLHRLVRRNSLAARAAVAVADAAVGLGLFRYAVPYYFLTFGDAKP